MLIYIHDMLGFHPYGDEQSFWKTFRTMPWLALPFKDPNCLKLYRIFRRYFYQADGFGLVTDPALVIVGPHGEFFEPCGHILLSTFGIDAFPYNRKAVANIMAERVKKLTVDFIYDPDTNIIRKDMTEVLPADLAGVRIMVYFENDVSKEVFPGFRSKLKEKYLLMKGSVEEFEVIHVSNFPDEDETYNKLVADVPWLVHPLTLYGLEESFYSPFRYWGDALESNFDWSLMGFDGDGRLVGRTMWPRYDNEEYPYYCCSDLEEAVLTELNMYLKVALAPL